MACTPSEISCQFLPRYFNEDRNFNDVSYPENLPEQCKPLCYRYAVVVSLDNIRTAKSMADRIAHTDDGRTSLACGIWHMAHDDILLMPLGIWASTARVRAKMERKKPIERQIFRC
jgi:hypothetical protein